MERQLMEEQPIGCSCVYPLLAAGGLSVVFLEPLSQIADLSISACLARRTL